MLLTAEQLAEREEKILAPYAAFSCKSRGRKYKDTESKYRTCFQRDRDRIVHTKAFRRLKHKTQVFVALEGDHYRDRLTHSVEVALIARDIARSLGLNEDLAESIALAHDLGHTPFGHSGEEALNKALKSHSESFEHNNQSRLIVEELEQIYPGFDGLNLSFEVRDGLIKHQSAYDQNEEKIRIHPSLEAQIVNLADEIAYNCHDLDDGLRSGILDFNAARQLNIWKMCEKSLLTRHKLLPEIPKYSQRYTGHIIHLFVSNIIKQTELNLEEFKIQTLDDVYKCPDYLVNFTDDFVAVNQELRAFLMNNFYLHPEIKKNMEEGQKIIRFIFKKYLNDTDLLPAHLQAKISNEKSKIDVIRDFIAGMTDNYARNEYNKILKNAVPEM